MRVHPNVTEIHWDSGISLLISFSIIAPFIMVFSLNNLFLGFVAVFYVCFSCFSPLLLKKAFPKDPFHPYWVYRLLVCFSMVLPVVIFPRNVRVFSDTTSIIILLTAVSFVFSMDIIYISLPKLQHCPFYSYDSGNRKIYIFFIFLWFLGWVTRFVLLKNGIFYGSLMATHLKISPFGNLLGQLSKFGTLALFGYAIFSPPQKTRKILFIMTCTEIVWVFVTSGSKIALFSVLIPLLLIFHHKKGLVFSFKKILQFSIVVALVLFSNFFFAQQYRTIVQSRTLSGESLSIEVLTESIKDTYNNSFIAFNPSLTSSELGKRTNWALSYGLILEKTDLQKRKWYGSSYVPILTWWIPRILWPEKPVNSVGLWFAREVLGWNLQTRSEAAITLWGDAVMNFGLWGILPVQMIWILTVFLIYHLSLRIGPWGLLFLSTNYLRLLLSLEQNAAVPIAAFQQNLLIIFLIYSVSKICGGFFTITLRRVGND